MELGKYELISRLALGGMAEVFLAKAAGPMGFEKTLVVKRILAHLAEDPDFVQMFLTEARLAAQLNHPNIIQIFDFGEANGAYFLAMEYIDGPNLRVLLKKARLQGLALPPALCARIVASACEGLAFAHDFSDPLTHEPLGLIHRDVSADNILVSRQGAVKVVDFGIAKAAGQSHKTQSGLIKGKVAYMSPEQIRAKPLDRRVDVYALGVVFYELLTGRKPFDAPTDAALMEAIISAPLVPAAQYRPELSPAVQRILERALAKDRDRRYANCRAFQIDLEDFILSAGKPVGAYELSEFVTQLAPAASADGTAWKDTGEIPAPAAKTQSSARTVKTPKPQFSDPDETLPLPPREPDEPDTLPVGTPVFALPSKEVRSADPESSATEVGVPSFREERSAPVTRSGRSRLPQKWIPALVGAALLLALGGYLAGSRASSTVPAPVSPPAVATRPQPPPAIAAVPKEQPSKPPAPPSAPATNPSSPIPSEPSSPPSTQPIVAQQAQPPAVDASAQGAAPKDPVANPPSLTARPKRDDTRVSASRTGVLRLVVRGWADIWVDGEKKGRVPPVNELTLSAGRHELHLINPAVRPYRAIITITAGKTLEHRVLFQSAEGTTDGSPGEAAALR
jgi:serine/threonine protein kinase